MKLRKYFGPSTLIAAAFIGPGTLTTCTMAGVQTGYTLLWAMLFSVLATIVLQEMAARLGFITRQGLGEAINKQFAGGLSRYLVFFLVIGAILVGNAAYEAGNISGGVLGLELVVGEYRLWPLLLGGVSFALLFWGKYQWIERLLVSLVILMSVCFMLTAILVQPDWSSLLWGFVPGEIDDHFLLIMGLIGTTVVPYNLFLHASTISKKWDPSATLNDVRTENRTAIILGGIISMLIIITAAASRDRISEVGSAADLAVQLVPLAGNGAKWLMGIGLLAAGLSSALTAPLAAAYAAQGLFGWEKSEKAIQFRLIWIMVLGVGILISMMGWKPVLIIQFAQITNAVLLPLVAGYLLYIVNSSAQLGAFVNKTSTNISAVVVILLTILLAIRSLYLLLFSQ